MLTSGKEIVGFVHCPQRDEGEQRNIKEIKVATAKEVKPIWAEGFTLGIGVEILRETASKISLFQDKIKVLQQTNPPQKNSFLSF
jgi:hypothetical protein